ncbi:MAG: hypothetical protein JO002_04055 [Burkholderiaceae bacterium]|nr:hypothetical protein [Burkholderiaceae bacterium]
MANLQAGIDALRKQQSNVVQFCALWRSQAVLLDALPPRYREVMEDLLGRLESNSAFSEESCSYSQTDLLGALEDWLTKAKTKIES